jgi:hypothetical protein
MSDIAAEMRKASELRGDTYSSMEIWGLLGRGAAEIERLQAEKLELANHIDGCVRVAAEALAKIEQLQAAQIKLLNWLNTHHPNVAVAFARRTLERKE